MATEKNILQALDLLTTTPEASIESMDMSKRTVTRSAKAKLDLKNVIGVGISEKVSNEKKTGTLAMTFYVEKKIPLEKLKASEMIPALLPGVKNNEMIPTDIIEIGKLKPEGLPNVATNPIQPGNSIGHPKITAGTFGALVTDGKDEFILSNSHVLARSGKAKKGDVIIYPGTIDGGKKPTDVVARLHDFIPFTPGTDYINEVDCAIAKPIESRIADIDVAIKDIGIPKGVIQPKRGMKVIKTGRTTGNTEGEIKDVHFRFILKYDQGIGQVGFINQVFCTRYTDGGDSGSLVLDKKTGKAVGLHFAGANGGSVFNPIDKVLSKLGVSLVTKAKGAPQTTKKKSAKKKPR